MVSVRAPFFGAAILVFALLCGCGGGGGGSTPVPAATAIATPMATPSGAQTLTAGASPQSAMLTGTGAVTTLTVGVPATTDGTGSLALALSATPPGTTPAAQSLRRFPRAIGGTVSPVAYLTVTPSATVTFASSPSFGFTLATAPAGSNFYVGFYDSSQSSNGWTTSAGPGSVSGSVVDFAAATQTVTLQANVVYVFALVSTSQLLVPHVTAQTFAGGGTLTATFAQNVPAVAHSAVITFTPPGGTPVSTLAILPAGCSIATCSVSLSAPAGANAGVQALLFASSDGSGPALAVGSGTISIFVGQTTTFAFPLAGIMASFTLALSPATVTEGQETPVTYTENALDASGEALSPGFVGPDLQTPKFTVTSTDSAGFSNLGIYSGVGSGPITYTATSTTAGTASASLNFSAAASATIAFSLASSAYGRCAIDAYTSSGGTPVRSYLLTSGCYPIFDKNATMWFQKSDGVTTAGITAGGGYAGTLTAPGTLLTFDAAGNAYMGTPSVQTVSEYAGATLVRQINTPGIPSAAAVDPSGNVYVVAGTSGTIEYPPTGTGSVTPVATNSSASLVGTDASGNVYAVDSSGIGIWAPGTFSGSPGRTVTITGIGPTQFGVDAAGDLFGAEPTSSEDVYEAAAGASTFTALGVTYTSTVAAIKIAVVPH